MANGDTPDHWHLVSFPRSGNHLLRTLIEAMSGRPTLGCPDNPADVPIHMNLGARGYDALAMTSQDPIGYKSHNPAQAKMHQMGAPAPMGLIYLTRDPHKSIASSVARLRNPVAGSGRELFWVKNVREMAVYYEDTLELYKDFDDGPKLHLRFEDLIGADTRSDTIARLARLMGLQAPDKAHIDGIYSLAKTAQISLPSYRYRRMARLAWYVPRRLRYARVLDRIADSHPQKLPVR